MISYFKRLFTDETVFVGVVRGALGVLAVAPIEALPEYVKPVAMFAALFLRSSSSAK